MIITKQLANSTGQKDTPGQKIKTMKKYHSLLLSTPMVLATLRGDKNLTRRTPSCTNSLVDGRRISGKAWKALSLDFTKYNVCEADGHTWFEIWSNDLQRWVDVSPIYNTGDELWFKESFRLNSWVPDDGEISFRYEADGTISDYIGFEDEDVFNNYWVQSCSDLDKAGYVINPAEHYEDYDYKALRLRPNIFMPRAACRLFATIPSQVTCSRLQDITEEQAKREGVEPSGDHYKDYTCPSRWLSARDSFMSLWSVINGPSSWLANPPVYVIPFNLIDIPEVVKGDTTGE